MKLPPASILFTTVVSTRFSGTAPPSITDTQRSRLSARSFLDGRCASGKSASSSAAVRDASSFDRMVGSKPASRSAMRSRSTFWELDRPP